MSEQFKVVISYKDKNKRLPNGEEIYESTSTTNSGYQAAIDGALQTLGLLDENRDLLQIQCIPLNT